MLADQQSARPRDSLVVVPTCNSASLERLVECILRSGPFDVLIVDTQSAGGPRGLAEDLAAERPALVSVIHCNSEWGDACSAGYRHALQWHYERVFALDVSSAHDPACLPVLRRMLFESADVITGGVTGVRASVLEALGVHTLDPSALHRFGYRVVEHRCDQ